MLTDTLPWFAQTDIDSPWRRLHWTLPLALLICAIAFIWFAYSMGQPANHVPEPVPVDAELVELPEPTQPQVRQKTIAQPKKEPAVQPEQNPQPQQEQPSENPVITAPSQPPAAPVTVPPVPGHSSEMSENRGAQALVQPLPVIPDDLRQEAMNDAATARFQIEVDGSVTVELVKPTQNPRLNRLLLNTLKNWKFFPAIKEGKPVASVEVMVIRMQVK